MPLIEAPPATTASAEVAYTNVRASSMGKLALKIRNKISEFYGDHVGLKVELATPVT